jgi:hypothetical protein
MRKSHEYIQLPASAGKKGDVATAKGRALQDLQNFALLGKDGVIRVGSKVNGGGGGWWWWWWWWWW